MRFFFLLNTKYFYILKKAGNQTVDGMQPLKKKYYGKSLAVWLPTFKISSFVFSWRKKLSLEQYEGE